MSCSLKRPKLWKSRLTITSDKPSIAQIFPNAPDDIDLSSFDPESVPSHLAVIMDGNGRWATSRGLNRAQGHVAGIKAVRELIRAANDVGIRYLTIYSFSSENWSRPKAEVQGLMALFAQTMAAELAALIEEDVRIRVIGDMGLLPQVTRRIFSEAVQRTQENQGMTLIIAVNYGGRQEIVRAAQKMARLAAGGELSAAEIESLTVEQFAEWLDTADFPDPDLLIRASGEYRLSNFLLYQLAYSEMYFSPLYWPDFDRYELLRALLAFQNRNRRFGGVAVE